MAGPAPLGELIGQFEANLHAFIRTKGGDPSLMPRSARDADLFRQITETPALTPGGLAWKLGHLAELLANEDLSADLTNLLNSALRDAQRFAAS